MNLQLRRQHQPPRRRPLHAAADGGQERRQGPSLLRRHERTPDAEEEQGQGLARTVIFDLNLKYIFHSCDL